MTLDKLYEQFCIEKDSKLERTLCNRVSKLAAIVLKQFKIYPYHQNYEDYMQTAHLVFWEILAEFDPNIGKLEGFFMVSFKHQMIDLIKAEAEENKLRADIDVDTLTNDLTTYDMYYVKELETRLDDAQVELLYAIADRNLCISDFNNPRSNHLEIQVAYEELSREFNVSTTEVKDQITLLAEKLQSLRED